MYQHLTLSIFPMYPAKAGYNLYIYIYIYICNKQLSLIVPVIFDDSQFFILTSFIHFKWFLYGLIIISEQCLQWVVLVHCTCFQTEGIKVIELLGLAHAHMLQCMRVLGAYRLCTNFELHEH